MLPGARSAPGTLHPAYLISIQAVTTFASYASIVAVTGYLVLESPPALPGV